MSVMDKFQLEKEIARLDGFLSGCAARNGGIRDYSAGAYLIELNSNECSVEKSLKDYYEWLPSLAISNLRRLDYGMRDLETEIRAFLVRGFSNASVFADEIPDMKKHLSFMAMEIISSAIGDDYNNVLDVTRMSNVYEPLSSKCDYFCIRLQNFLIFLQFNDDIEFRKGRKARP
jgi:hypothetical protein